MTKLALIFGAFALVFFTACGGGGGGGGSTASSSSGGSTSSSGSSGTDTSTIAAAGMLLDPTFAQGLVDALGGLSDIGTAPQLRSETRAAYNVDCQGGGTVAFASSSSTSFTLTFNQCVSGGSTINGKMTMSNATTSGTNITGTYQFVNLTADYGGTSTYMNATVQISAQMSGGTLTSYDMTLTGTIESTSNNETSSVTFTNYHTTMTNSNSISINGKVTVNNNPEVCNSNGTYTITTVTPITYNNQGDITGGQLTINGDTYTFNSNGTVTVNGQTYDLDELEASCVG